MKTKNLAKILLVLVLAGCMFVLTGCPVDFIRYGEVKPIRSYPNTFTIIPVYANEHIRGLSVTKTKKVNNAVSFTPTETVWDIVAVEPIPAKIFIVTIGKVPPGFKQKIPSSDRAFIPIPGVEYRIFILTDGKWSFFVKKWIAE